jgi:hypothetical protein
MSAQFPRDADRIAWWKALRECTESRVTTSMRAVLFALSSWADPQGGECFPSQKMIAAAAGLKEKTAQSLMSRAERLGWVRSWSVHKPGTRLSFNRYRLTIPGTATIPIEKARHRSTTGSLTRGAGGKFKTTTPLDSADDTAAHALTTPLHSGNTSPLTLPVPHLPGFSTKEKRIKERAQGLMADGHDDATIAGIMWREEIPAATLRVWRLELQIPF